MEKITEFISPAGKSKLTACTSKRGTLPLFVVGIHIGETELFCSKAKQAGGPKSAGLVSVRSRCKKVEWQEITDFVVPPQYFDFHCTPGVTYKEAISSFIRESTLELIKKPTGGVVVIAYSFPVHVLWEGADHVLQLLLDRLFSDKEWIIPAVVSISEHYADKKEDAVVYAGKTWTTFFHGMHQCSVSFGTETEFHCFRCNDYLNNSTREWTQKAYPSWEVGFLDLCRSISEYNREYKSVYTGFADEKHRKTIERIMIDSELTAGAISWKNPADETLRIALPDLGVSAPAGRDASIPKPVKPENKKDTPEKATEDLFKW